MAVVTSKGMSKMVISMAKMVRGNKLGIRTKMDVRRFFIKISKHMNATKKAAKNDLNWVSRIKRFNCAKTTANPFILRLYLLVSKEDSKAIFMSSNTLFSSDVLPSMSVMVNPAVDKSSENNLKKLLALTSTLDSELFNLFSDTLDWNKTGVRFSRNCLILTTETGLAIKGFNSSFFWNFSSRFNFRHNFLLYYPPHPPIVTFTLDLVIKYSFLLFSATRTTFCVFESLILVVAEHMPISGVKENLATSGAGLPSAKM